MSRMDWPCLSIPLRSLVAATLLTLCVSGCKEEEKDTGGAVGSECDPAAETSECAEDLTCESAPGTEAGSVCAVPLTLRGLVVDAEDAAGIEDARVFAMNAEGAPVTDVVETDGDGNYELYVPVARDAEGNVDQSSAITLAASASGYLSYPGGIRPAIPVSLIEPTEVTDDDGNVVGETIENATTTVVLVGRDPADATGVSISGSVDAGEPAGTLVLVDVAGTARSGVADLSGDFRIFDVPAGTATVDGFKGGLALAQETREVSGADVTDVVLSALGDDQTATVEGSVSIVNAPGGAGTSVVLIPKSVYDPVFERGSIPFGLRAPAPGVAPNVNGGWTIEGVPPGTYMVLAAFENDGLVRDPDTSIAGTEVVEITVPAGETLQLPTGFKVTAALGVTGPGAELPEAVSGPPTFVFEDDSSEDFYEVVVYDARGDEIWKVVDVPGVSGAENVELPYEGPALEAGMYYQFRATSIRDKNGQITPISRTEDLRGLFVYTP